MREGRNLVGVDIGSSAIKVCQIRESRKALSLSAFAYENLPPQAIVDGQVMDSNTVVDALQNIFKKAKIRQREVGLSVSGQSAIIRNIAVPIMTAEELAEQIQWEAEQHIPFDIKEVYVDYQVLRRDEESGQMDLLLVAAKRDQINDYVQLARDARLKPVVCDIDAFSIQNLFQLSRGWPGGQQAVAILNVGASLTSLNVVAGGASAFRRDIVSGGNLITEQVQKALGVSYDEANSLKCSPNLDKEVAPVVEAAADSIAAEIQRSLDFFMATSGDVEIGRVYLTGGTAKLPFLAQAIERRARVIVEHWEPVERLEVDNKRVDSRELSEVSPQLAVALGLALRKAKEVHA